MSPEDTAKLGKHDGIVVRFGQFGTQYALYVRPALGRDLHVVRKWRVKSNSWTKEVQVYDSEIIRRAKPGEYRPTVNLKGETI